MVSNLLADSFFIAICHLTWLSSRKYGTVWYHPASSKLWYLTTLSFVNFQGKLTGTLWNMLVCEASLFGLLCAWRRVRILRQQVQPMKTCVFLPKVNYFVTHRAQNFTSATTPKLHDANRRAAPPSPPPSTCLHRSRHFQCRTRVRSAWVSQPVMLPPDLFENLSTWFIRNLFFYISQTKLTLDNIFYKVVYHHIVYMCDFFRFR
jgi:hypothetical protein